MKKQLLLAILPLLLCCCKKSSDLPRLITTADTGIEVDTKEMLESRPTLLAFNFKEDTVVGYKKALDYKKDIVEFHEKPKFPENNLKIIIDTTYSFYSKNFEYKNINNRKLTDSLHRLGERDINHIVDVWDNKSRELKNKYIAAYPVLIYNNSAAKAYITNPHGGTLLLVQEALDADGKWKPIEFRFGLSTCFIRYSYYVLSPKHYIATAIIKYKGNFKTKVRVKMISNGKVFYSNAVLGTINRSQFNQDFVKPFLQDWGTYDEKYFEMDKDAMFLNYLK
jgi:hypothetical protein